MRANVEAIVETRRLVSEKLKALGFTVGESQTNFLWAKPPEGITAEWLFKALRAKKIFVRYFSGKETTRDYLRITVGTAPEMLTFLDETEAILKGENDGENMS